MNPFPSNDIMLLTEAIFRFSDEVQNPVVIAVDGARGSGKSTIAKYIGSKAEAAIIPLDDFFRPKFQMKAWITLISFRS